MQCRICHSRREVILGHCRLQCVQGLLYSNFADTLHNPDWRRLLWTGPKPWVSRLDDDIQIVRSMPKEPQLLVLPPFPIYTDSHAIRNYNSTRRAYNDTLATTNNTRWLLLLPHKRIQPPTSPHVFYSIAAKRMEYLQHITIRYHDIRLLTHSTTCTILLTNNNGNVLFCFVFFFSTFNFSALRKEYTGHNRDTVYKDIDIERFRNNGWFRPR
jgi:hypothetical protein